MKTSNLTLSRKFFSSKMWTEERVFSSAEAWIDLIQRAAWRPVTVEIGEAKVRLARGEFCYSIRYLADAWKWSKSKVARWLAAQVKADRLVRVNPAQEPEQDSYNAQVIYRLVNYDAYQLTPAGLGTATGTATGTNKNTGSKNTGSKNTKKQLSGPAGPETPAKSWSARSIDIAREHGFYWTPGRITRALKDLIDLDGPELVLRAWTAYCRSRPYLAWDMAAEAGRPVPDVAVKDTRFVRPEEFRDNYGFWLQRCLKPSEWAEYQARRAADATVKVESFTLAET